MIERDIEQAIELLEAALGNLKWCDKSAAAYAVHGAQAKLDSAINNLPK